MGRDDIYLTAEGYDKLRKEIEYLKTIRLKKLSEEIAQAREHGDISENADPAGILRYKILEIAR